MKYLWIVSLILGCVLSACGSLAVDPSIIVTWMQATTEPTNIQLRDEPAPSFSFTTFDGVDYQLSDFRGKVVVLNFWSSWCVECGYESESLQAVWEYYAPSENVVFLGVAYADNEARSLEYIEQYGITYLNTYDLNRYISDDYGVTGVPETFIIDQDGNITHFIYGVSSEAQLTSIIEGLLTRGTTQ